MTVKYAVIRGTISATLSGTADFTQTGFGDVKAAIIIVCNGNATNNPQDTMSLSIGFWEPTPTTRSASIYSEDAVTTMASARGLSATYIANHFAGANPSSWSASAITNGIRLTLDVDNTTVQRYATVILFGGTDVSSTAGTVTPDGTSGNTATISGLSFRPDVVFFISCGNSSAGQDNLAGILTFGIAVDDGSLTQRALMIGSVDNVADAVTNKRIETNSVGGQLYNDTLTWTAELTAFSDEGFTLTTRDGATGGDILYYLAIYLGGHSVNLQTLTTPTSAGDVATSSLGFTPQCILAVGSTLTAEDSTAGGLSCCIGASDDTTDSSNAVRDEDNVGDSDSSSLSNAVLIDIISEAAGAQVTTATLKQFDSDGYTLTYSAAGASAYKGFALAMGTGAATTANMLYWLRGNKRANKTPARAGKL